MEIGFRALKFTICTLKVEWDAMVNFGVHMINFGMRKYARKNSANIPILIM